MKKIKYKLQIEVEGCQYSATENELVASHCDNLKSIFFTNKLKITDRETKFSQEFDYDFLKKYRKLSLKQLLSLKK